MPDQIDQLREWGERQLEALKKQREGLERRIVEITGFLTVLDQTSSTIKETRHAVNGGAANAARNVDVPFGVTLAKVLRQTGRPMSPAEVTKLLESQGYSRSGESSLGALVAVELPRQASRQRNGIRRVGPGLYAADREEGAP